MLLTHRKHPSPVLLGLVALLTIGGCEMPEWADWNRGGGPGRPKGETWTILCLETVGDDAAELVDSLAIGLRAQKPLRADLVRVDHDADQHRILYGEYVRAYSPERAEADFPPELRRDMDYIRQLYSGGGYPFLHARPVPLEPPAATGPGEWDLTRASGDYTLLIGVYSEIPERRQAAEQHVRALREQGEEAYYYHDAAKSHVCVGTFAASQMTPTERGVPRIDDPRFVEIKQRYPHFSYNGRYISNITRDARGEVASRTRQPTRLVQIPRGAGQSMQ